MNRIILFICLIVLSSCFKERIELDLNDDNKTLVITGWLTNLNEPQSISLSRSVNYLGNIPDDYVLGADVRIDDGVETFNLIEGNFGHYFMPSSWQPRVGNIYRLIVTYEGIEYTAEHKMRPCPEIESLTYRKYEQDTESPDDPIEYETLFSFQEMVNQRFS